MKAFTGLVIRALVIAMMSASIGAVANLAADDPVPWVYAPSSEVVFTSPRI